MFVNQYGGVKMTSYSHDMTFHAAAKNI